MQPPTSSFLQQPFAAGPDLIPMARIACDVGSLVSLGDAPKGERRYVPLTGGVVAGPELNGRIQAGGADGQVARRDGVLPVQSARTI